MISNTYSSYMPAQKVTSTQKNEQWRKQCVDAIIGFGTDRLVNGRSSRENKQINYNLYNSKSNEEDFEYVTNPMGNKENYASASKMQNYNLIRPNIEVLKGEEIKRPFNFFVKGTGGGAATAREQRKKELILSNLRNRLYQELGIEPEEDENGEVMELPDIEKYMKSEFADSREITANQVLNYLLKKENLEMKFNMGWEHALISAEEIYYVGISNGEPKCRVVNSLNFEVDKDDDVKFIEDAQWCREHRYMSLGSILDTYGEFLKDEELDKLDRHELSTGTTDYGMQPAFAYDADSMKAYASRTSTSNYGVTVINVCWKAWKKIGFLRWIDEAGEQEQVVDDTFTLTKELTKLGAIIEWRWINSVWEGTRIGSDIYVNIRELPNQTRNMSNPSECKLPYTGYIYNNTNSQATSILDLIKPHQYTYNIIWWRFEQELAKSKGKAFIMDIAQIPKTQGWDVEQWLYYFDNLGVAFINSMEEGRDGDPNSVAKFNQFNSIDRGLSQAVSIYFEAMNKVESMVDNIVGISSQRRAQTSPSESATANQNSIIQSSHMTEPYFYFHNELKKQVLTKLLECAKIAYMGGKKIHFIADEIYTETITVDGELFPDSDYGVFVTNSSKDNEIKNKVEGLFNIALQQEKMQLSSMIKGFQANSISEMASIIAGGEAEFTEREQQNNEANRQQQADAVDKQIEDQRQARENDNTNRQLDRENKLQVATLNTLRGKDGPSDLNANGIPDAVEQGKLMAQIEGDRSKQMLEQQKIASQQMRESEANERAKEKNQNDLLKQQIDSMKFEREQNQQDALNNHKAKLEAMKVKLAQAKLASDMKDKAEARKLKMRELDAKERIEKMKIKHKPKSK